MVFHTLSSCNDKLNSSSLGPKITSGGNSGLFLSKMTSPSKNLKVDKQLSKTNKKDQVDEKHSNGSISLKYMNTKHHEQDDDI